MIFPPPPLPGSKVHIPASWYEDEYGVPDVFMGGECTVGSVVIDGHIQWVTVVERPGHQYSWKNLQKYVPRNP
jgi:hypothetical protein